MAKLFVICGHGAGDPGADGGGYTEAERVRALGARIKALGGSEVEMGDTSRNWYRDGGINRLETSAPVVELHMDASGVPGAHGAHVIIKSGFAADEYDRALADRLSAMMPGRAEKIVHHSELANVNRAARRGINYRLVENGFIDSPVDRAYFNEHVDDIARVYLEVFGIEPGSAPSETSRGSPAPSWPSTTRARPSCSTAGTCPATATSGAATPARRAASSATSPSAEPRASPRRTTTS